MYWRWLLHRWACMWNLYIVKKWIIDVHGATKGHLSPGDEPLQNPPSSMMFPWINAHLQHARWFASHVWWQSGYIGYISWSPKFQFFILFLHDYSNLHGHPHGWLLNPMKSPRKSQFFHGETPMGNSLEIPMLLLDHLHRLAQASRVTEPGSRIPDGDEMLMTGGW